MDLIPLARTIFSLILAVAWLGVIPIYGQPFGGCETNSFLTIQMGCSSWPEAVRGFGFILIPTLIAAKKYQIHYVLLGVVLLVTILGGVELITAGTSSIYANTIQEILSNFLNALPALYGATVAVLLYIALSTISRNKHA